MHHILVMSPPCARLLNAIQVSLWDSHHTTDFHHSGHQLGPLELQRWALTGSESLPTYPFLGFDVLHITSEKWAYCDLVTHLAPGWYSAQRCTQLYLLPCEWIFFLLLTCFDIYTQRRHSPCFLSASLELASCLHWWQPWHNYLLLIIPVWTIMVFIWSLLKY